MKKKLFRLLLFLLLFTSLLFAAFVGSIYLGFYGKIPTKDDLLSYQLENASIIYSADGKILSKVYSKNRTNIAFNQIPNHLIEALIATEDIRFYEHDGFDTKSILRVIFKSLFLGNRSSGGGSTISQQLAKNMFGRAQYEYGGIAVNKIKEIILAKRIEEIYSKENILSMYLNTVPFGENLYGIEAAASRFFNKKTNQLNISESATLIGLLKANTSFNPRLHPEQSKERRNVVLAQMAKYEYINQEDKLSMQAEPIQLNYYDLKSKGVANYFAEVVKKESIEKIKNYNKSNNTQLDIEKDGLKIYSTLNYEMQISHFNAMVSHLSKMQKILQKQYKSGRYARELDQFARKFAKINQIDISTDTLKTTEFQSWEGSQVLNKTVLDSIKFELTQLQAAMLSMDVNSGAILAWQAGFNQQTHPYDQVFAKRQMASNFKPIVYLAALENGYSPCDYLDNDSIQLTDFKDWQPQNYDKTVGGKYSLAAALAYSKNLPTVHLFLELGFENIADLWKRLKFEEELPNEPSIALGSVSASVFEVVKAYASFANSGYLVTPYIIDSIVTAEGELIYQHQKNRGKKILNAYAVNQLNYILQKAIQEGTGASLSYKYGVKIPLAGKTGTSQSYADAWFTAYNPKVITVARVGASFPFIHFAKGAYGSASKLALPLVGLSYSQLQQNAKSRKLISMPFPKLSTSVEIDCPDYKEESSLEKFLDVFKDRSVTFKKSRQPAKKQAPQKKKKGFFKRLFGN